MKHYYVVTGNEFGADLSSKKNFKEMEDAFDHYEKVKQDDYGVILMFVNDNGKETIIEEHTNE